MNKLVNAIVASNGVYVYFSRSSLCIRSIEWDIHHMCKWQFFSVLNRCPLNVECRSFIMHAVPSGLILFLTNSQSSESVVGPRLFFRSNSDNRVILIMDNSFVILLLMTWSASSVPSRTNWIYLHASRTVTDYRQWPSTNNSDKIIFRPMERREAQIDIWNNNSAPDHKVGSSVLWVPDQRNGLWGGPKTPRQESSYKSLFPKSVRPTGNRTRDLRY